MENCAFYLRTLKVTAQFGMEAFSIPTKDVTLFHQNPRAKAKRVKFVQQHMDKFCDSNFVDDRKLKKNVTKEVCRKQTKKNMRLCSSLHDVVHRVAS